MYHIALIAIGSLACIYLRYINKYNNEYSDIPKWHYKIISFNSISVSAMSFIVIIEMPT